MFGKGKLKAEIADLKIRSEVKTRKIRQQDASNARLKMEIKPLEDIISRQTDEIEALRKQLRKQNSVDILVNAFEAVGIIPNDEKKDCYTEHGRLMQYSQQMMNASGQRVSLWGLESIF